MFWKGIKFYFKINNIRSCKVAVATKVDLILIPSLHIMEGKKRLPQIAAWPPHEHCGMPQTQYTKQVNVNILKQIIYNKFYGCLNIVVWVLNFYTFILQFSKLKDRWKNSPLVIWIIKKEINNEIYELFVLWKILRKANRGVLWGFFGCCWYVFCFWDMVSILAQTDLEPLCSQYWHQYSLSF